MQILSPQSVLDPGRCSISHPNFSSNGEWRKPPKKNLKEHVRGSKSSQVSKTKEKVLIGD